MFAGPTAVGTDVVAGDQFWRQQGNRFGRLFVIENVIADVDGRLGHGPWVLAGGSLDQGVGLQGILDIRRTVHGGDDDAAAFQLLGGQVAADGLRVVDREQAVDFLEACEVALHHVQAAFAGAFAVLVVIYWPKLSAAQVTSERAGRALASMVLALPAAAFLVPNLMGIKSIYLTMAVVIFVTAVLGCMLSYDSRRTLAGMAVLSLVASVFITADLLLGKGLLLRTPLGFDDVFMGGRYYGINNDCMGILIGSTAFSLFYFLDMIKANRTISVSVTAAAFALVAISQTPPFGANVGGTIAAGTTGVIAVMALATGKPLKSGRVVLTVAAVFMAELLVAYWDYRFGSPTHAGKVMGTLLSQGFGQKFLEVLESKLSLFGLMLVLPPWNLILAAEAVIYYQVRKRFKNEISGHRRAHPVLAAVFEVIFYGGLVAFAFNDTGVIATALMFTYLAMPVGVLPINTKIVNIDDAYHKEYKRDFR